jgi:hypothetical protein
LYILPDVDFLTKRFSKKDQIPKLKPVEFQKLEIFFEIKFEEVSKPKLLKLCEVRGYDASNFGPGEYDKNVVKDKGLLILPQSLV